MNVKIIEALRQLDRNNDDLWTGDGLPRIDVVEKASGLQLKRRDITMAAPEFTRDDPKLPGDDPVPVGEPPADDDVRQDPVPDGGDEEPLQTDRERLEAEVRASAEQLAEFDAGLAKAHAHRAEMQVAHDRLVDQMNAEYPPLSFSENVKQFIAQQHANRVARVTGVRAVDVASGHAAKSPLDASMARRNTRGTQRPQVPLSPKA